MTTIINGPEEVKALQGVELPPSSWMEIDQARIDAFAACTDDPQWIHVDQERAAASPFGATIAHGLLTLSLIPRFWHEVVRVEGFRMNINYGVNRVRFPAPLPVGSRIRGRFQVGEVTEFQDCLQVQRLATIERDGHPKPVCVAETVLRLYL